MSWTKEHPEPPLCKPSDWYWFIFDNEKEEVVIEVWPERKHWPIGLWGPRVERPEKNQVKQEVEIIEEEKPIKKRRGRPPKEKNANQI